MKKLLVFNFLLIGLLFSLASLSQVNKVNDRSDDKWQPPRTIPKPIPGISMDATLEILVWQFYIPNTVLGLFTETYGTKLNITFYENNEELLALYHNNPKQYDIMMPSDYMVSDMMRNGYLAPINQGNIPMMKHLKEDILRVKFDPGLRYSIPFYQSTLGIAFNVGYITGFPRNWSFLFGQQNDPYLPFRIALLNEPRTTIGIALIILGFSPNTKNPEEIQKANDYLVTHREILGLQLSSNTLVSQMNANEVLLSLCWNGTCSKMLLSNPNIRFMLPEEPTITSLDCFVINANSKKKRLSEFFINFLLIPEISAEMTNYSYYANTNVASLPYIDRYIRNGPGYLFPSAENAISLEDVKEATMLYKSSWKEIQDSTATSSVKYLPLPHEGYYGGVIAKEHKNRMLRKDNSMRYKANKN